MDRRSFLTRSGFALGATMALPAIAESHDHEMSLDTWADIRRQFNFDPNKIPMSQMLLASHPKWVRDAIDKYRTAFDLNPVEFWEEHWMQMDEKISKAAAAYLRCEPEEVALTDSTTMGLGILYSGLRLKTGDEILTTTHDHFSTEKALEYAAMKNGATIRRVSLFKEASTATFDEILSVFSGAIGTKTKVIAVTWVHSNTGMKLPIKEMSEIVKNKNQSRTAADRIYFCVDGVHGFGIEDISINDLGCDFFAAGAHKWIFGPRGTGILWAKKDAWKMMDPTIPPFSIAYAVWLGLEPESKVSFKDLHSPGGFHSFEHRWALPEAFEFHIKTGKDAIQARTRLLNSTLKEGLKEMKHVKLRTPVSPQLSAGINCFEVAGKTPAEVVKKLLEKNIIGNTSPYKVSYARLTPSIVNSPEEVTTCLKAIEGMKS